MTSNLGQGRTWAKVKVLSIEVARMKQLTRCDDEFIGANTGTIGRYSVRWKTFIIVQRVTRTTQCLNVAIVTALVSAWLVRQLSHYRHTRSMDGDVIAVSSTVLLSSITRRHGDRVDSSSWRPRRRVDCASHSHDAYW